MGWKDEEKEEYVIKDKEKEEDMEKCRMEYKEEKKEYKMFW
jgi:hypothetical protein